MTYAHIDNKSFMYTYIYLYLNLVSKLLNLYILGIYN
jgi:hypothetical protein